MIVRKPFFLEIIICFPIPFSWKGETASLAASGRPLQSLFQFIVASFEDFGIYFLWIALQAHENIAECSLELDTYRVRHKKRAHSWTFDVLAFFY